MSKVRADLLAFTAARLLGARSFFGLSMAGRALALGGLARVLACGVLAGGVFAGGVLAGCGGGGGSSSSPSVTIAVKTDWSARNTAGMPTGASEQIIVHPLSSPSSQSAIADVNAPSGNTQQINLPVWPGMYVVHIDLYSGSNATGSITGSLDAIADNSSGSSGPKSTVQVAVGKQISSIQVFSNSTTITAGQSVPFFATPISASGTATFAAPHDVVFGSLNTGVLAVDPATGVATGIIPGVAGVSATSTSTSVSGQSGVTVQPVSGTHKAWTIMVFMNASNSLESYALPNFLQMQRVAAGQNVNLVVQWKESSAVSPQVDFNETRRYLVLPSTSGGIASTLVQQLGQGVDMGSYKTLTQFVAWAKQQYPADRYALDIWDHGDGWQDSLKRRNTTPALRGVSYDDETGNHISSWQMDEALAPTGQLDILAYDACLMQQLECDYQVRNYVHYVVCSEDNTPGPGYDYSTALAPFYSNPSGSSELLSQGFVDSNINNPNYTDQIVCQSVVDETQVANLAAKTSALADVLIANVGTEKAYIDAVRAATHRFDDGVYNHFYFDLSDLCAKLQSTAGAPSGVAAAAQSVQAAVAAAVTYNRYNSLSPNSNGIAIDFSDAGDYLPIYQNLAFAQDTDWSKWLSQAP